MYKKDDDHPLFREKIRKSLSKSLEARLNKVYTKSSSINDTFHGKDITFITNEYGEPYVLYIGERQDNGKIKGDYYIRTIKRKEGILSSSHWDNKGKV